MRQMKAAEFRTAYEYDAEKKAQRKQEQQRRGARVVGRGRSWQARPADEWMLCSNFAPLAGLFIVWNKVRKDVDSYSVDWHNEPTFNGELQNG